MNSNNTLISLVVLATALVVPVHGADEATMQLFDVVSDVRGEVVPVSVILPPNFEDAEGDLPLLISLHGGGGDRMNLVGLLPVFQSMWDAGELPPLVMVSFSSGPVSWYRATWENFVVDELPRWAHEQFGTSMAPEKTAMTGISMGGYGTLKIAFKHPTRFRAIAPMEPAIEPSLGYLPDGERNTWYREAAFAGAPWGAPMDVDAWLDDNPATLADRNAETIRQSGLEIYLEVGDQDYILLHDGAEFLHRVLWDRDIRHEYHLVRWADHVGRSVPGRVVEAFQFLANALAGGLAQPTDLPLSEAERAYTDWIATGGMARGVPMPAGGASMADPDRGPSVHAAIWDPQRETAADDPAMQRAYAELAPTREQ